MFRIAVVGATGVAGSEIVQLLEERRFPVGELIPFASARSVGRLIHFDGQEIACRELGPGCFEGVDLVLMEAPAELARQWAPMAVAAGALVVDNSSAYRYDDQVPLIVPEINLDQLRPGDRLIASPNCTTLAMVPVLKPLDQAGRLKRVIVTTYQAVSGTGQAALAELEEQVREFVERAPELHHASKTDISSRKGRSYPHPIAFNVIPQADDFTGDAGLTKEENKLIVETRKILGRPDLPISPFCTRVPVWVGHSMALICEFERPLTPEDAEAALANAPGVTLWPGLTYPTPLDVAGTDGTHVGRIHRDPGDPSSLAMWVSGDNLRKGAGLNNVQIAEELVRRGFLVSV
ncbi:MAG TPA: aspartate-semialdehyde dehydrogenase [Candidatus Dormibacteraeota bacterium]|jgi:aspartate-semialdehyde dehydrogenase|nr:aspartate-semialdehyde dehydrogenase [Candidatus Dormibacteraeota bacterium]